MADKPSKHRSAALAPKKKQARKEFCAPRVCVRLDNDVQALINASAQKVAWGDCSHAINAGLRLAYQKFAGATIRIRIHPFDQLALAKKRKNHTRP